MIELDLLPPEHRKKKGTAALERMPEVTRIPLQFVTKIPLHLILLCVGGGLLALYPLALLGGLANVNMLKGLQKELEQISPERESIHRLFKEYKELEAVEAAVQDLNRRISWSEKLQQLSDAMVWGIWLREISLRERPRGVRVRGGEKGVPLSEKVLILTGSAASLKGDQTAMIGRFIRSLKENKDFFSDFTDVEYESIRRRSIESLDVMDFKIICAFREGL